MGKIRVLLVDDHTVVRQGLRRILETDDEIEIVGEAGDGRSADRDGAAHAPERRRHGHRAARAERHRGDAPDHEAERGRRRS